MLRIDKKNNIFITESDNAQIEVTIYSNDRSEIYEIESTDTLILTVKDPNTGTSHSVQKTGSPNIDIDGEFLSQFGVGQYDFEVKLVTTGPRVQTVVSTDYYWRPHFFICENLNSNY